MSTVDIVQTIAIIASLLLGYIVFRRTRRFKEIDAYNAIIQMMNDLRKLRIQHPDLERALFETRRGWDDAQIKKHVYAVGLANIFEWVLFSEKLI